MTREEILENIRKQADLDDDETTIRAARAVVCSLRDRLSPEEAQDFLESLRGDLPELLHCESHPHRRPEKAKERLTEPEVVERVRAEAGLKDQAHARRVIRVVLASLSSRMGGEEEATPGNVARGIGSLASRPRSRREEGEDE
ncbi:DUF2267 domain-containing protein [Vulgatibacter sp.]|uniref:DUF2267 domain-containing protein n=1 Tax=Vulgatibacter sp. TaxID=1971226 RepID=UPI00356174B4